MKGKQIQNYENYSVTEDGEVWSYAQKKPKKLKPQSASQSKKKYLQVRLFSKETPKGKLNYIHRLVWETYKGDIPEGKQIDHINSDTQDNKLENLQVVTARENMQKYFRSEEFENSYQEYSRDHRFKFKELRDKGLTYEEIGKQTGVSLSTAYRMVNDLKNKRTWKNGKYTCKQVKWTPKQI